MLAKKIQFIKAIRLRKSGMSYSEIANIIGVSKSTLSIWLRNVHLKESLIEILEIKKHKGQIKGALARKNFRIESQKKIEFDSVKEINSINKRDLWLMGTIAYWCEGTKQKEQNISQRVVFTNSDPILLNLFVKWLIEICKIDESSILFSIYIHETGNELKAIDYWSNKLKIPSSKFTKTVLKKHNVKTNRKNVSNDYNGLVRITVKKSTILNRRIKGWVLGISKFL